MQTYHCHVLENIQNKGALARPLGETRSATPLWPAKRHMAKQTH
jgi:hypothetical protein